MKNQKITQELRRNIQSLIVYYDVTQSTVRGEKRLKATNKLVKDLLALYKNKSVLEKTTSINLAICDKCLAWYKADGHKNCPKAPAQSEITDEATH